MKILDQQVLICGVLLYPEGGCLKEVQPYFQSGELHHTNIKEELTTRNLHINHKLV